MKQLRILLTGFVVLMCFQKTFAQKWNSPVPLIPNSHLKDVAKATYNDSLNSFVIEYNPEAAVALGPFTTAFFQAHEYGHIYKGHISKKNINSTQSLANELEADQYATEMLYYQDKSVLNAALMYMVSDGDQGSIASLPYLDRVVLINKHLVTLDMGKPLNVACVHKLDYEDQVACTHYNTKGVPMHDHDVVPCTHVAHLEGDIVGTGEQGR